MPSRIIGGEPAGAAVRERFVIVLAFFGDAKEPSPCGGTVISDRYVLTAAHCVVDANRRFPRGVSLFANAVRFPDAGFDTLYAKRVFVHRKFSNALSADIALLEASAPLSSFGARVAQLAATDPFGIGEGSKKAEVFAAGYGNTRNFAPDEDGDGEEDGRPSPILLEAELTLPGLAACRQAAVGLQSNLTSHVCAAARGFPAAAGDDTCTNDSGGPLYSKSTAADGNSGFVQIGITSYGPVQCARRGSVSWYTRVDTFLPDIRQVLDGREPTAWFAHS